jgi:hypothetical protein
MKVPSEHVENIVNAFSFQNLIGQITDGVPWHTLPNAGYAIPMAIECVKEFSNYIVDHVPRFSSADHGTLYKILSHILKNLYTQYTETDFKPFFLHAFQLDESLKQIFLTYRDGYHQLNTIISLKEKIWELEIEGDDFHLTINPQYRRNALHILDVKANHLANNEKVRELLKQGKDVDRVRLSLDSGTEELNILKKGVVTSWDRLVVALDFDTEAFTYFKGFVSHLQKAGELWFDFNDLETLFSDFLTEYELPLTAQAKFGTMLDFFSITFEQADGWVSPCPFYKINNYFIFWPFCYHVMHPDLMFINLIHRKYANEWNNTLGANMAQIAGYLVEQLRPLSTLPIVAEKKKGNLGDIDIAIYDAANDHLVLFEVKSVFDKFRTNYQSSNYIDQKVNVSKAAAQLNKIETAILNGNWRLPEIFAGSPNRVPQKISKIILTWWDLVPVDDVIHSDILTLNFKTFSYLLSIANNNIDLLVDAVQQLGKIYCPYTLATDTFFDGNETVKIYRQIQTDLLPPKNMEDPAGQNEVFLKASSDLQRFPQNWQEQIKDTDLKYHFY